MTPEERSAAAKRAADRRWGGDGKFVYVIGPEVGPQKIGIAGKPRLRMSMLQVGNPAVLSIALLLDPEERSALEVEQRAHLILADKSLRGEWFDVSKDEAVAAVHQALAEVRAGTPREVFQARMAVTLRVRRSIVDAYKAKYGDKWRSAMEAVVNASAIPSEPSFISPAPVGRDAPASPSALKIQVGQIDRKPGSLLKAPKR